MTKKEIREIENLMNNSDWSIAVSENADKDETATVTFTKTLYFEYSDTEFGFQLIAKDLESLTDKLFRYYVGFDPSYEAFQHLNDGGKGPDNVPMIEVYNQFIQIQHEITEMIQKLRTIQLNQYAVVVTTNFDDSYVAKLFDTKKEAIQCLDEEIQVCINQYNTELNSMPLIMEHSDTHTIIYYHKPEDQIDKHLTDCRVLKIE